MPFRAIPFAEAQSKEHCQSESQGGRSRWAAKGGCTNSRPNRKYAHMVGCHMRALLSDSGVDTIRFRWREDNVTYLKFQRRPEGTIEGHRGERYIQTPLGRIDAFPDGMCYMEGRAAAINARDRDEHALASIPEVYLAEQAAAAYMRENGCELGDSPARLGRIDLASELRFDDPQEGSAFLHSLASLDVPWCKSRVDGRKGANIETVSFHGTRGKTIYLRAYDKGVESGTQRAGVRIRMERQKRFRKEREPLATDLDFTDLRRAFWGREFSRLSNLRTASVVDLAGAMELLCERATNYAQLERLAGYLLIGNYPWAADTIKRDSRERRDAELRALGVFVDPTQIERLEVPMGAYLQTLGSAWAA